MNKNLAYNVDDGWGIFLLKEVSKLQSHLEGVLAGTVGCVVGHLGRDPIHHCSPVGGVL